MYIEDKQGVENLRGFTVVELLIVIVVIGILATLTIIAYAGVQNNARNSVLQSDVEQASKKLQEYKIRNAEAFPATQALAESAAGIKASPNTTMTYYTDPSSKSYCVQSISNTNASLVQSATYIDAKPRNVRCIDNGMVAAWNYNGNVLDSESAFNGTATNVAYATGQNGASNGAIDLSGTGYVNYGNLDAFKQEELTMSAWINPTAISGVRIIMAKEVSYKYRLNGSNIEVLRSATGSGWSSTVGGASGLTAGQWAHTAVVLSQKSNTIRIYINGSLIVSGTMNGPYTGYSSNPLLVGAYNTAAGEPFVGQIDDARFYGRTLSAEEVAALYAAGAR